MTVCNIWSRCSATLCEHLSCCCLQARVTRARGQMASSSLCSYLAGCWKRWQCCDDTRPVSGRGQQVRGMISTDLIPLLLFLPGFPFFTGETQAARGPASPPHCHPCRRRGQAGGRGSPGQVISTPSSPGGSEAREQSERELSC